MHNWSLRWANQAFDSIDAYVAENQKSDGLLFVKFEVFQFWNESYISKIIQMKEYLQQRIYSALFLYRFVLLWQQRNSRLFLWGQLEERGHGKIKGCLSFVYK